MRKNERERLARRAAYKQARVLEKPFGIELPPGWTIEQFNQWNDLSTAYHEAGHAVAAWMQGIDSSLSYVPKGMLTEGKDFSAITGTNHSLERFITEPNVDGAFTINRGIVVNSRGARIGAINDGGVTAYKHAFITLAGPIAELSALGEVLPDKAYQHTFKIYGDEAHTKLVHFMLNASAEEIIAAQARIADLVVNTFQEPRVIACVRALAERFHKTSALDEQKVRETIAAAWAVDANGQAEAAKAGK